MMRVFLYTEAKQWQHWFQPAQNAAQQEPGRMEPDKQKTEKYSDTIAEIVITGSVKPTQTNPMMLNEFKLFIESH